MSIGYIMRDFPVLYHNTVLNEIRVLRSLGHSVRVFSILQPVDHELATELPFRLPQVRYCWTTRAPAFEVVRSNLRTLLRVGPIRYLRALSLARRGAILTSPRAFVRLVHWANEMLESGVDHLHAHWATEATTVALIFSWLTRLPFSFTAHAYDIFRAPQFFELKLDEAKFAVTVSEYNKSFIVQNFGPRHADKVHVIYPLIDLSQFAFRAAPGETRLHIVSVARLTEYKGLAHLVDACHLLKQRGVDFVCQIVGEGEDRPLLEERIARHSLGAQVQLLGALPNSAIPALLERATVFALPCLIARNGDRDGMPLVLIEAMARGVPVVTSDAIGLPELVRDGAGRLARPGDPEDLANALQMIADMSPEAREAMGRAGRRIVESFDAPSGTKRLLELICGDTGSEAIPSAAVRKEPDVIGAF